MCLTRDGALACLHDAYLPLATTLTGWAHERCAADVLAERLLDREGRASAERARLVGQMLDLVPPGLMVQVDVKAHADVAAPLSSTSAGQSALLRGTMNLLSAVAIVADARPADGRRSGSTSTSAGSARRLTPICPGLYAGPFQD